MPIVETRAITGGVDTHADTHVAAALDPVGGLLGVREFAVTAAGYSGLATSPATARTSPSAWASTRHPSPNRSAACSSRWHGKANPYVGIGSRPGSGWLFAGLLPGRPITPARLAERLRALGIPVKAGRRAALIDLAAQLPAAVLADLLGLHPTTAVAWMHQAGGDWTRYAAQLARSRNHQP